MLAPPPPPAPLAPFDTLHEVWALTSLQQQRQRVSTLFGLPDGPDGCLCFTRVALDDTFQHLRFASTLALSPAQARFVHQLVAFFFRSLQLPDAQWSTAALRDTVKVLLATNCTELLPGTTYVDTTHLLPALDLPSAAAPSAAAADGPLSVATVTPASSRPSTAASKRPPPTSRSKPVAPPSPQQQPVKPAKPLTAKEKEAAAVAEKAAIAAAEVAAAEAAAALAALPPPKPTAPPHFLTSSQREQVWQYVAERLLAHSAMYRECYHSEARRRREADRTDYVWRRVKLQPGSGWARSLHEAASEQPIVEQPADAAIPLPSLLSQPLDAVDCDLQLLDGDHSDEERDYLLHVKAAFEQQLRQAATVTQSQQQATKRGIVELEEKEQDSSGQASVAKFIAAS